MSPGPLQVSRQHLHRGEVPLHVYPLWMRLSAISIWHRSGKGMQAAQDGK